jgi:hypothetical protein
MPDLRRKRLMGSPDTFKRLRAQEIYCPKCRRPTPVRERLLLFLPGTGEMHDLVCAVCGESVGKRTEQSDETGGLVIS